MRPKENIGFRLVGRRELGQCPCAVYMTPPLTVEVNMDVWPRYDRAQQLFLLAHELGHYDLHTGDEAEADRYAIRLVAGSCKGSLKGALRSLLDMGVIPHDRFRRLYSECLAIDAARGNLRAANELKNI